MADRSDRSPGSLERESRNGGRARVGFRSRRWINAVAWGAQIAFARLAGLVRTLLVAWILTPASASVGFLAMSVGRGAVAAFETGSRQVIVTAKTVDQGLLGSAFALEVAKGTTFALILVAVGLLDSGDRGRALMIAAPIPFFLGLLSPYMGVWEREEQHTQLVLFTAAGTIAGLVVTAVLLLTGTGWTAMPLGLAAGHLATALASHRVAPRVAWRLPGLTETATFLRKGFPFTVVGLSNYLGTFGIDLVLASSGALHAVAPFRIASTLVQTLVGTLPGVVTRASLAAEARAHRERADGGALAIDLLAVAVVSGSTLVVVTFCLVSLPTLSVSLLGDQWHEAASIVPAVTVLVGVRTLSKPWSVSLMASGSATAEARVRLIEAMSVAAAFAALGSWNLSLAVLSAAAITGLGLVVRMWTTWLLSRRAATGAVAILGVNLLCWGPTLAGTAWAADLLDEDATVFAHIAVGIMGVAGSGISVMFGSKWALGRLRSPV